jgi:hypothetical protein
MSRCVCSGLKDSSSAIQEILGLLVEPNQLKRQSSRRFPFLAEVRVTESNSGEEIWGETRNLSKSGCYISTRRPLLAGSMIELEIRHGGEKFIAAARVVYDLESEGMGTAFINVRADHLSTLERWILASEAAHS